MTARSKKSAAHLTDQCGSRQPKLMELTRREVFTSRYYRSGRSHVVVIPPELGERVGFVQGDQIFMVEESGVILMRKITRNEVIPRAEVAKIMDKLFPGKDRKNGSE